MSETRRENRTMLPRRRAFLLQAGSAGLLLPCAMLPAHAHHGWSSFDQERPIYLEGRAAKVRWANPHAEIELELPAEPRLPADLKQRAVPAQTAPVDGPALLARAQLPKRPDRRLDARTRAADPPAGLAGRADRAGCAALGRRLRPGRGQGRGGAAGRVPVRRRQGLRAAFVAGMSRSRARRRRPPAAPAPAGLGARRRVAGRRGVGAA